MQNNVKKELIFGVGAIVCVILMTFLSVKKIQQREDLALLQVDFTDIIIEAKLCLENKGIVQDPSQGRQGKVFICSNQDIAKDTFPVLQKLSRRGFEYRYLAPEKCFSGKCDGDSENDNGVKRINIGRGNKLVLSCDVAEGVCQSR
jgi:hypothetical protein